MKDVFKMSTMKDYLAYDIKCKFVSPMKNEHEMRKKINRKVRRNMKQELKKNVMIFD